MASIGALTLDSWRGTVQWKQSPVEVITRAGVSGTGMLVGATIGVPYQVETYYKGTLAEVQTWRNTAAGYVGTAQTVVDAQGESWADTAILSVEFQIFRAKALGGTATHLCRATWTMSSDT